nr:FAD-dependent oxidoreductase [Raoultibacter phocaeensis]
MDRRHFLAGVAGATALGVAGCFVGCSPAAEGKSDADGADQTAAPSNENAPAGKKDWLGIPPEVADVSKTVDAEVVIVGAGVAGLAAGLAAIENGVKPIILEKGQTSRSGGGVHGAVNTKLQAESGITFTVEDIDKFIKAEMKNSGMNADESLLRVWAAESGAVLDKIVELTAADGVESRINTLPLPDYDQEEQEYFTEGAYPVGHAVGPGDANGPAIDALTKKIQSEGGEFYYSTPGVALIQDEAGNVTGVYGQQNNQYIRFNASKGVIVTTGEYGNNPDMVDEFVPQVAGLGLNCFYAPPVNTGDGHKMMVWAGAEMQRPPHAPMTACTFLVPQPVPFLLVNKRGERFQNEASSNFIAFNSVGHQPDMTAFQVFDSRWADVCNELKVMTWENTFLPDAEKKAAIEEASLKADTLEELAALMGIDPAAFAETVARRNALADSGHDDDFGLPLDRLVATKITDPPFFANQNVLIGYGVCLGGVWVNKNMQVLKKDGSPIDGLYAAGNTVGRRFGTSYFQELCGLSNGMADAHGYVAGRSAATRA